MTKVGSNHFEIDRTDSVTNKPMKFKHNGYGYDYKKTKSGRVKGLSRTSGHIVKTVDDKHLDESFLNEAAKIVNTKDTDYHIEQTKEKVVTEKHPEGKPVFTLHYKGDKIGTIKPYSGSKDTKKPGSRIVSSRKYMTMYNIQFDNDKGPSKISDMSTSAKFGHANPKWALETAATYHSRWVEKNK